MSASPPVDSALNHPSDPALPQLPSQALLDELSIAEQSSSLSAREVANLKERLADALYDEGDVNGSLKCLAESLKVYEEYNDKRGEPSNNKHASAQTPPQHTLIPLPHVSHTRSSLRPNLQQNGLNELPPTQLLRSPVKLHRPVFLGREILQANHRPDRHAERGNSPNAYCPTNGMPRHNRQIGRNTERYPAQGEGERGCE